MKLKRSAAQSFCVYFLLASLFCIGVYAYERKASGGNKGHVFCLCDASFATGALCSCMAALALLTELGQFSMLKSAFKKMIAVFTRSSKEDNAQVCKNKKVRRTWPFLFAVGAFFVLMSLILLFSLQKP